MPHPKIATCCYCGTRAALVLRGESRHELCCASCGAPLHELKALKTADSTPARGRADRRRETAPAPQRVRPAEPRRKPPKKRRKSIGRRLFSEALDLIEDIFD